MDDAMQDSGAIPFEIPVRQVTLLEDRAQVRREGPIVLAPGSHRLRVAGVAPVIADRTLVVRAGEGLRVDEVRVRRWWRVGAEARPLEARELLEEYRRQAAALTRARALHDLLEGDLASAEAAVEIILGAVNRELPHAEAFEGRWTSDLAAVLADVRERAARLHVSRAEIDTLRDRLATVLTYAARDWRVDFDLTAELVIDVTATAPGGHQLSVDYVVPCAMWRPMHRATLAHDRVRFECEGAVWQATGEDWVDVALAFSTARPTQRAEPPLLTEDRLRVQKKLERRIHVEVREQAIATTGEGSATETSELQGVDDGGEIRLMHAPTRATVGADGHLQRIPIFAFEAPAEVDRVARPERSPLVHLRSRQVDLAPHPILAGPIELLSESGYVGSSAIGFVAPGERFVLGWGGDEALRVARRVEETREVGRVFGKQTITRTVSLFLSNLDDAPARFRLEERVPVSEIAEVEIEIDPKETRPRATADDQGIVGWDVSLAALGSTEIALVYRIVAGADVTL